MIGGLNPYPVYTDSGVPWLKQVPAHWDVRRIKTLFREKEERSGDGRGLLLSLTRARGLLPQSEASNRLASASDFSKYKVCRPGDLVMNRMQAWSGMFAVSACEGLVSPDYSVFAPIGHSEVRYFEQLFKTPVVVDQFAQASKGVGSGFNRLYSPDFGAVPVVVPPLSEQAAIVRFLHHADRRIRRYIRAKQKLIKLLEEQKQAIIHRAVTRGLDPNVRLKPSGVEWLGDVPEHWNVVPLKRIGTVRIGLTYSPGDVCGESGTLVLRASNVSSGRVVHADNVRVSKEIPATLRVREGDILVCVRSGSRSLVGKSALITQEFEGASYGAFMSLLRTMDNRFYFRVLHSNLLPTVMAQFETSTINQLTQNDLRSLMVPVPPGAERAAITDSLDGETTKADGAIAAATAEINLLRQYRTRLIADVVTGKLDVRETAARLPQDAEDLEALEETGVESEAQEADADDTYGVPEEAEA